MGKRKEIIDKPKSIKLENLIPNSDFEELELVDNCVVPKGWSNIKLYNDAYSWKPIEGGEQKWYKGYIDENKNPIRMELNESVFILDSKYSYSGTSSILLDSHIIRDNKLIESNLILVNDKLKDGKHKYYFRCYSMSKEKIHNTNFQYYPDVNINLNNTKLLNNLIFENNWISNSYIFDYTKTTTNNLYITVSFENKPSGSVVLNSYIDALLLIDLTATFGQGYEPSKEWCDSHIPYFRDTYNLNIEKKFITLNNNHLKLDEDDKLINKSGMWVLNRDDFAYCYDNNTYYHYKDDLIIKFAINDYDNNNSNGLRYTYNVHYINPDRPHDSSTATSYYNLTWEIITNNNVSYFKIKPSINNDKPIDKCSIYITSNNSIESLKTDKFTWRNIINYENSIILDKSTHLDAESNKEGKLNITYYNFLISGETNPFDLSPTTIKIYVNDTPVSGIEFEKHADTNCKFRKLLYLSDGQNHIKIEAIDIFGDVIETVEKDIYVDILHPTYLIAPKCSDNNLLHNFVSNDAESISLTLDNVNLSYYDKNYSEVKDLKIDTSVMSHFFKLEGENSEYYRISRDNLPAIRSNIIKKPINVNYYKFVEKIYDGNTNITDEMNNLKYNNGYQFNGSSNHYNEFSNMGFNTGMYSTINDVNIMLYDEGDIYDNESKFISIENINMIYTTSSNNKFKGYILNNADSLFKNTTDKINIGTILFEIPSKREDLSEEITKTEMDELISNYYSNPNEYKDIFYYYTSYTYEYTDKDEVSQIGYKGIGVDLSNNLDIKIYKIDGKDLKVNNQDNIELYLKTKLFGIDNFIYSADIYKENTEISFKFNTINDLVKDELKESYTFDESIYINYYYSSNERVIIESDEGKVFAKFDKAYFDDKNVVDYWKPIRLDGLELTNKESDTDSNTTKDYLNYQIKSYNAFGRIKKKDIDIIIDHKVDDSENSPVIYKIYDGTPYMPFNYKITEPGSLTKNGLIDGDEVFINNEFITINGDCTDNNHLFKSTGPMRLMCADSNVGNEKQVIKINKEDIILEGRDINNYNINKVDHDVNCIIKPRDIHVVIDSIRLIRSKLEYEISYHFTNKIDSDNLDLDLDNLSFYGGYQLNSTLTEIITDYSKIDKVLDGYQIHDLIFKYNYKPKYKFVTVKDNNNTSKPYQVNTIQLSDKRERYYWTDNARVAEPNTERIDISIEEDSNYPGEIKINQRDILASYHNDIPMSYFESEDKIYRIYNNQTIKIFGIRLNPNNDLSKNYNLITETATLPLQII